MKYFNITSCVLFRDSRLGYARTFIIVVIFSFLIITFIYGSIFFSAGRPLTFISAHPQNLPNQGWWSFTDSTNTYYFRRRRCNESNSIICKTHSCFDMKISLNLNIIPFCYPKVILTGVIKSGTSFLWQIFVRHPQVAALPKELCPLSLRLPLFENESLHSKYDINPFFFVLLSDIYKEHANKSGFVIFGSCLDVHINSFMDLAVLKQKSATKYIMIVRSYSSRLWSSFNFWCDDKLENNCPLDTHWTSALHSRSPELFDSMVRFSRHSVQNGKKMPAHMLHIALRPPLWFREILNIYFKNDNPPCQQASHYYLFHILVLMGMVPGPALKNLEFIKELQKSIQTEKQYQTTLLILSSEAMHGEVYKTWSKIAYLASIDVKGFSLNTNKNIRYNSQKTKVKGPDSFIYSSIDDGSYIITGNRTMLPETFKFLRRCWRDDCLLMTDITGWDYHCWPSP